MFDKKLFIQHNTNTTSHNKMAQAGVNAPFSLNEQSIPMNVSTNVNRSIATAYPETTRRAAGPNSTLVDRVQIANEQERDAAAPKVREKLEIDALKRMVGTPEYAAASDAERSKMLDRALESIGDDPSAIRDQFTTGGERDAAYQFANEVRSQNIQRDVESRRQNLSDEERMLPPDELRRRGLIGSRYTGTAVSQGRPADSSNPFGPRVSTPEDKPTANTDATRREPGSTTSSLDDLFAAQDELSALKLRISDDRRRRASESSGIMSAAQRDLNILDRSDNVRPTDTYRPTLRDIGNTIQRAGGDTPEQRAKIISDYRRRVSERPRGFGVR